MSNIEIVKNQIISKIKSLIEDKSLVIEGSTPLIGGDSLLDSMRLVELCLLLEDTALEEGFEFDWTSDTAMSKSRGMFRTVDALVNEFCTQMDAQK